MATINFAAEVMADGPIGYWRLGEPPGSVITADTSGNGNIGECSGGITFGHSGFQGGDTAALFDGATSRIIVKNSNSLNPPHITMEAKVRWDGPNTFQQRILEKSCFKTETQYSLSIMPMGNVLVELRIGPSQLASEKVLSTALILQGVETHVVATYEGNVIRIYLNGVLDIEKPALGILFFRPPTPSNLIESGIGIGNDPNQDRPFKGLIDEVALYPTALSAERVIAHYKSQFSERVIFQYAAKFICGKSDGTIVAPGSYFTAVNVHNPTYSAIHFRVKAAVALPGLKPGPVSKFYDAKLGPDEALEIDCPDIQGFTGTRGFLKGFVVIESEVELDVVAVYTATGREERVETLHTECISPRQHKGRIGAFCVDFEPPLKVGTKYGAPVGHLSGDVVFTANRIPVSIHDFTSSSGGGTFFNVAQIDLAPIPFGSGQSIRMNNICLGFDFSNIGFKTREIRFEFLDLGGSENISVNGSPVFAGDLFSVPNSIGGVNISVNITPVAGGNKGTVILTGAVQTLKVGGQEFWIDNVCARE